MGERAEDVGAEAAGPALPSAFWTLERAAALRLLGARVEGLSESEAAERRTTRAARLRGFSAWRPTQGLRLFLKQFQSPLIGMLVVAALLAWIVHSRDEALILLAILLLSGLVGFAHERRAGRLVESLLARVAVRTRALRDGQEQELAPGELVPGDVLLLAAGSEVPADGLLLEAKDLYVSEAALTGESLPVEKEPGASPAGAAIAARRGALFAGSHVTSGRGRLLVCRTGERTVLGGIATSLGRRPPPSDFERGVQRFGAMLLGVTLVLVLAIFAGNVLLHRPALEAFLFSLALAVGMTPELLPAIVSVNLARGARRMASANVIVKHLPAIENLGTLDLLCCDKTGTLTEGRVALVGALDLEGRESAEVLACGVANARFQSGLPSPLDDALRATAGPEACAGWRLLDEVPYDFVRKRLSVLVEAEGRARLITKGALAQVLEVASTARSESGLSVPLAEVRERIERRFEELSERGLRVLGVAERPWEGAPHARREDEQGLCFLGFLTFSDPPKAGVQAALARLGELGIGLRILTGDNRLVAAQAARAVGFPAPRVVTGAELRQTSSEALLQRVREAEVFAELEPSQKERILLAAKAAGYVVGFLGDGINDAPALHAADVGFSVEGAVDVAKRAAEIVLLEKDLGVLAAGVEEGRRTFVNTLKYVYITASANFGNMLSMAVATLFLPFLPLLPSQILLNNFLSDLPAMTIAGDRVDPESLARPRRWNVRRIRDFMLLFGAISAAFDFLAFAGLLWLAVPIRAFRTAWFLESLWTEIGILFVMRTARPLWHSAPARGLWLSSAGVAVGALLCVQASLGGLFELAPLRPGLLLFVGGIALAYAWASERAKHWFFRRATYGA